METSTPPGSAPPDVIEIEIGEVTTDGNGVGDKVIEIEPYEILNAVYEVDMKYMFTDISPESLPSKVEYFKGPQYLQRPSFLLEADVPVCKCGEECCLADECTKGEPCPSPAPPIDGQKIVSTLKLTSDGAAFFQNK
jgi:hypothetical protein